MLILPIHNFNYLYLCFTKTTCKLNNSQEQQSTPSQHYYLDKCMQITILHILNKPIPILSKHLYEIPLSRYNAPRTLSEANTTGKWLRNVCMQRSNPFSVAISKLYGGIRWNAAAFPFKFGLYVLFNFELLQKIILSYGSYFYNLFPYLCI